ncbi:helix-turn-helix domain-containing protein [Escherichia coli]|uniref:helix-turn-helix domain-containing protein n=1 Tax=Escherichia coli TaxID=562 RepID=UPI0006A64558|nr:helix-turn-helix domain-containing protein [Escherichia coli]EEZ8624398.1 helix-turn-helix domain-containing protein [Escherichia coli O17]EFA7487734.1 helix-turn-helix domain-containing protein [Escherichia coli]EFE7110360.1 helix-turn-helix domain-containing protein [Escherichia coli]EFH7080391.1 helix-turn-helix domain-containing protein [Escherichia coli]EFJ3029491.1 helix-turn-helix domain-containing protein [Escherichia coli]
MTTLEITTYRIKLVLEKTGLKQAELARRIGVAQQSVQKWVHGITSPSTANLDKLSEVTGFPPYWFMLPPNDEEQVVVPDTMKIGPRQRELLQTFGAFPEEDQEQMLKDMKDKKESMDRTVARWLAAQKGNLA